MFKSVYAKELTDYYELRQSVLSKSSLVHEKCYLKRFDEYLSSVLSKRQELTAELIDSWIHELCNRLSSIENEVVIVRILQSNRYYKITVIKIYFLRIKFIEWRDLNNRIQMTKELINQINRKSNDEYNTNSRENMIQCTAILISSLMVREGFIP